LLRRGRGRPDAEAVRVSFGEVEVDFSVRQVTRGGEAVRLTPLEYRLLAVLLANAGKVMTHRQLLREVWGQAGGDNSHYLRIYVGHLRHKLEDDPAQPRHFLTETGVGYRFHL
ncbi:MAG TPA: winged helix-turn-helix domain-containing protein, partial [Zoogloea sp.]|nr:winged helix-turn-helix domain-containing protein [Zoogloea sp.]